MKHAHEDYEAAASLVRHILLSFDDDMQYLRGQHSNTLNAHLVEFVNDE